MRTSNFILFTTLEDFFLEEERFDVEECENDPVFDIRSFYDENGFSREAKKDMHLLLSKFDCVYLKSERDIPGIKNEINSLIEDLSDCIRKYPFEIEEHYESSVAMIDNLIGFKKVFALSPNPDIPNVGALFKSEKRGEVNVVACIIRYIVFCLNEVSKIYPDIDIKKNAIHKYIQAITSDILISSDLLKTEYYIDGLGKNYGKKLSPSLISQQLKMLRNEYKSYSFIR